MTKFFLSFFFSFCVAHFLVAQNEFITEWEVDSNQTIVIPTHSSYTYNYTVDWGDGTVESGFTGNAYHTYALANTYSVQISGVFPAIYFNKQDGREKIQTIEQWGTIEWESMEAAFFGCYNLTSNASDTPDLSKVSSMANMFRAATTFNSNINAWNVSNVTNMSGLFAGAKSFDQPLNNWNTSQVTNASYLFVACDAFNQDIANWEMGNVTFLQGIFKGTAAFDQDISAWNVSKVINFGEVFQEASKFTGDISGWDTSNGKFFGSIFKDNTTFNQDISAWNMSNAKAMNAMFEGAIAFNQDLSNWNIVNVTTLAEAFSNSGLSTANYDNILNAWAQLAVPNTITIGAEGISYCESLVARQKLIDEYNWEFDGDAVNATCVTIWDGTSWNNGSPSAGMSAQLNGDYDTYVDGVLDLFDLIVSAGSILTIRGDSNVTVSGNLYNVGTIHIQDTSAFVQTTVSPVNSGTGIYTIEREAAYSNLHYNYWSSPVQNTSIDEVFSNDGNNYYSFNASSQSWEAPDKSATLLAGTGFIATGIGSGTKIRTFSDNSGFHSGTIRINTEFDGTAGVSTTNWNLIGNPYPSGIDVAQFLTDNNGVIENGVYIWSSDGNDVGGLTSDYATINTLGVVNAGASGIAPTSATISSAQGFFVQTLASDSVEFNNNQRVTTNNTFQRIKSLGARVWLQVAMENGASNELLIGFVADGEIGKEQYDAAKLSGNAHLSFYSLMENQPMAIQGLPSLTGETTIPLGLEVKTVGQFTFSISHLADFPDDQEVFLYDVLSQSRINLRKQAYAVELAEGNYEHRFYLQTSPHKITSLVKEESIGVKAYAYKDQIYVQFEDTNSAKANISVFDILGKLVVLINNDSVLSVRLPMVQKGIYIVRVVSRSGMMSKKVLIR